MYFFLSECLISALNLSNYLFTYQQYLRKTPFLIFGVYRLLGRTTAKLLHKWCYDLQSPTLKLQQTVYRYDVSSNIYCINVFTHICKWGISNQNHCSETYNQLLNDPGEPRTNNCIRRRQFKYRNNENGERQTRSL